MRKPALLRAQAGYVWVDFLRFAKDGWVLLGFRPVKEQAAVKDEFVTRARWEFVLRPGDGVLESVRPLESIMPENFTSLGVVNIDHSSLGETDKPLQFSREELERLAP